MLGSAGAWADRPVDKQVGWFCYFSDCAGKKLPSLFFSTRMVIYYSRAGT